MPKSEPDKAQAPIACEVCLKEIPPSVDQSLEGPDYVYHYCGLECYEEWRRQMERAKAGDEEPGAGP